MDPVDHLKEHISQIEIQNDELDACRMRLRRSLPQKTRVIRPFLWLATPVAAGILALFLWPARSPASYDLEALTEYCAKHNCNDIETTSQKLVRSKNLLAQANGHFLRIQCSNRETRVPMILEALAIEKRGDVKESYLDELIDLNQYYAYSEPLLDGLMDRENNPFCVKLIRELVAVN